MIHYQGLLEESSGFYVLVDRQLKTNKSILKKFNKSGKVTVRASLLIDQRINPEVFTHYWKNSKGDVYPFVYEFRFLTRKENGKKKYVLVTWQSFMEKKE